MATGEQMTREERLAARLRDNLRRRKEQARALSSGLADTAETSGKVGDEAGSESGAPLSKQDPSG